MFLIYDTLGNPLLNSAHQRKLCSLNLHTMCLFLQVNRLLSQNQRQVINLSSDVEHLLFSGLLSAEQVSLGGTQVEMTLSLALCVQGKI